MAANLNRLLVGLAGLSETDAELPTPVLLGLTRGSLLPPLQNLRRRYLARDIMGDYAMEEEAAYLAPANDDARAFKRDQHPALQAMRERRYRELDAAAHIRRQPGFATMRDLKLGFQALNTHRPGKQVGELLAYLWFLSWEKESIDAVEAADRYLDTLPQLILDRYRS